MIKFLRNSSLFLLFISLSMSVFSQSDVTITVIAEDLLNPVGMALLPDGAILIAEEGTGERDTSAGVTLLMPDGQYGRLLSGFPSGRDSGDLSGIPLVGVSPDGQTIYFSHFNAQQLYTLPTDSAHTLPEIPLTVDDVGTAMERLNSVFLLNPFDITFDKEGIPVVTDASGNGVATQLTSGTTRFFHRFNELGDTSNERLTVEAVPTGITRAGDEYYVTLFGGCPYPLNSGELVAIDEERNQRIVVDNLSMPIDVEIDNNGTIWVVEFGRFSEEGSCFSGGGYLPETGRLSRLTDEGTLEIVLDNLDFPGAVLPLPDGSLYITEIFAGRVLHIQFNDLPQETGTAPDTNPRLSHNRRLMTNRVSYNQRNQPALNRGQWYFVDVAESVGLDFSHKAFTHGVSLDYSAMMGGGLCWIDYDRDGWLDLYLVNSYAQSDMESWQSDDDMPTNALYRNVEGQFVDVSAQSNTNLAMKGHACVAADFNNDGWHDLFVTADGANALLYNQGDGTFTEGAQNAGLATPEWNSGIALADLNNDGWLDIFIGGFIDVEKKIEKPIGAFPQDYIGLPDRLFLNNGADTSGNLTFTEITREVGLTIDERALGATFTDADNDGDLDLYIANDGHPNRLYLYEPADNPYGFTLIDTYETSNLNDRNSGMGVASGDWDENGWTDLIVTNWDTELNSIYRNRTDEAGYPYFEYATFRIGMRGLGNNMTGWGVHFADLDHDTDLDLLTVNGHIPITDPETDAEWVRLYTNQLQEGRRGEFRELTLQVGLRDMGGLMARGSALADYDNDGDLDLAINQISGQALLLENVLPQGNWLTVTLDKMPLGTIVEARLPDGRILRRETVIGSSYLASEDPRIHFGLGDIDTVKMLAIRPPSDEPIYQYDVSVNQSITITTTP